MTSTGKARASLSRQPASGEPFLVLCTNEEIAIYDRELKKSRRVEFAGEHMRARIKMTAGALFTLKAPLEATAYRGKIRPFEASDI